MIISCYYIIATKKNKKKTKKNTTDEKKTHRGPSRAMNLLINLPRSAGSNLKTHSTRRKKNTFPSIDPIIAKQPIRREAFPKPCEVS